MAFISVTRQPGRLAAFLLAGTCLSPVTAWAVNVSTETQLRDAIFAANSGGDSTINITGNITLTQSLPMITASVTVTGNNNTIDANNAGRAFFVQAGTVSISNLTINNAVAQGGDGGNGARLPSAGQGGGGGGGLGAGAAVFVNQGAAAALTNVTVGNASATGGAGGNGGNAQAGFGGTGGGGGGGLGGNGGSAGATAGAGGGGYQGNGGSTTSGGGGGGGGEFGARKRYVLQSWMLAVVAVPAGHNRRGRGLGRWRSHQRGVLVGGAALGADQIIPTVVFNQVRLLPAAFPRNRLPVRRGGRGRRRRRQRLRRRCGRRQWPVFRRRRRRQQPEVVASAGGAGGVGGGGGGGKRLPAALAVISAVLAPPAALSASGASAASAAAAAEPALTAA